MKRLTQDYVISLRKTYETLDNLYEIIPTPFNQIEEILSTLTEREKQEYFKREIY